MTVIFVLSGGTIIALCEKVISYKELISLTPLSAFGIRLNINLKYICAYSVQQVLLMNGGITHFHFAAHGNMHYIGFPPGITILEQITDPYDLCILFYALFYPSQFIKSVLLSFKAQDHLSVFSFLKQVPWVSLSWDQSQTLDFKNIVFCLEELIIILNIDNTVYQTE